MSRQISDRQAAIVLVVAIVSLKFLILPALVSRYALNDSYLSVIIGLAIDLVFMLIILWAMSKAPHLTFSEIIERAFGFITRRILNLIMFAYFFIKGILIIKETHNYFNETLFESINWVFYILPLFLIIFFVMIKDLKTVARSVEFFSILILAGIILTVVVPIKDADFTNLLPFLGDGIGGVFKAVFHCNFSFGDYFVLMLVMGRVDIKINSIKRIFKYIMIADVGVITFFVAFVGIFGKIGINQSLAISDMPLHSNLSSSIGRLDWVVIILWVITLIFQAGILFSMACHCLSEVLPFKNKYVPAIIIEILMLASVSLLYLNLSALITIVTSVPFSVISILIQVLVPLLVMIGVIKLKRQNKLGALKAIKKGQIKIQYTDISPVYNSKWNFSFTPHETVKKLRRAKANA